MWNSWFGGQAAQKAKDAPKKAIVDLRTHLDMLEKRATHLQNQMDDQERIAKANITKNKNAARQALKRKKGHETTLEQTQNQIAMLENQIYSIEAANINQETLNAMKNAGDAMKKIHGKTTIDKVDQIMEDLTEQTQLANEIGTAITNGPTPSDPVDEQDLAEELERLEQENLDEKMLGTGAVPHLPTPNKAEPMSKAQEPTEEDEEAELRKLQAEMAM